jgi:hypothetical protein
MTHEEFMKIEKEWINNETPTMFYIGELQRYKNSLEAKITELETLKTLIEHKFPNIFWNEFEIPKEAFMKPVPDLEVDTKVLVWDNGKTVKERRYFSHFDKNGNIYCFNNGVTGWIAKNATTIRWDNWELYKEEN